MVYWLLQGQLFNGLAGCPHHQVSGAWLLPTVLWSCLMITWKQIIAIYVLLIRAWSLMNSLAVLITHHRPLVLSFKKAKFNAMKKKMHYLMKLLMSDNHVFLISLSSCLLGLANTRFDISEADCIFLFFLLHTFLAANCTFCSIVRSNTHPNTTAWTLFFWRKNLYWKTQAIQSIINDHWHWHCDKSLLL